MNNYPKFFKYEWKPAFLKKIKKKPAVFLDRDGTINVEKDYLYRIEDLEFIPHASDAIRKLKDAGYLVFVVTNQSGVARGYFELEDVYALHEHMQQKLSESGAIIDGFYICPHHPTEGRGGFKRECDCRKGAPGLLFQAAADYDIDLASSYMIGDKLADIEAGERAGCVAILVMTGYGEESARKLPLGKTPVCNDLLAAAELILHEANA